MAIYLRQERERCAILQAMVRYTRNTMATKEKEDTKLLLRLPAHVRQQIEENAEREFRSLTGEILYLLDYALKAQQNKQPARESAAS